MMIEGPGTRLTVFVGESDRFERRPLATAIVLRAREMGLAGATVLRGVEGYGASNRIHADRTLSLSHDLPMVVVIVDRDERIESFLPVLDDMVGDGMVLREPVEIVHYRASPPQDAPDE
jgi:PII-like signaling protein